MHARTATKLAVVMLVLHANLASASVSATIDEPGCPRRPDRTALAQVARRIAEAKGQGASPLAVFDLDGTLLDPAPRTRAIFLAALGRVGPVAREVRESVEYFPLADYPYRPEDILLAMAIPDNLRGPLKQAWDDAFFTNAFLDRDVPILGAAEHVRSLFNAGGEILYLTGRPEAMKQGTLDSLRSRGFPLGPRAQLRLKSAPAEHDRDFKRRAAMELKARGAHVVALYENEPANLAAMAEILPGAIPIFVSTHHSPGAPPVIGTARCIIDFTP